MSCSDPIAVPVVTVDGPSGSGKGTISRLLASRLGWHFLDSGALYRALALKAQYAGVNADDEGRLAQLARTLDLGFELRAGDAEPTVVLDGKRVGDELRTEAVGAMASAVAALPAVRAGLVEMQRRFHEPPGLVADGRDMGTVIFPAAPVKVFLTATAQARALRRHKQLKEKGLTASLHGLLAEIEARDARDASRATAPLKAAPDALVIDSTELSVEAVIARIVPLVQRAFGLRGVV